MTRQIPPIVAPLVARASADAGSDGVPFWASDSEGVAEEGMYQLADELDLPDAARWHDRLPEGYGLVFAIFSWEQSRAGEGFRTGIDNSGTDLVARAAAAYERMEMREEAEALQRVLAAYGRDPTDHEAMSDAYEARPNPYLEDWVRIPHLVRALCAQADALFHEDASAPSA